MHQVHRIAIGGLLLLPIVAAALVTGFPAAAAEQGAQTRTSLSDRRVTAEIDRNVRDACRAHPHGSIEYSICIAEGRKDAYRAAASARRDSREPAFSLQ